jgi:PhzF family phenazine biosynthesis protein
VLGAVVFDVFADGVGGGNPCPVVPGADGLDAEQMQGIAADHGLESVFLLTPTAPGAQVRMRYFVPRHEMEMCVHATVAGLTLLAERDVVPTGVVAVQTPLGVLDAEVDADGSVTVEQFPPVFGPPLADARGELAAALGCPVERILGGDTPRSVSVSRAKLLVELTDLAAVAGLEPDPARVSRLCEELGVTGLYPFAVPAGAGEGSAGAGRRAWARQFPRDSGYPEDAATGLAAAALAAMLALRETGDGRYRYDIHQGQAMGRPSVITGHTTREGGAVSRIAVSGRAERRPEI